MARIISVTSPSEKTSTIVKDLKRVEGRFDLQVFIGVSVEPPGDVIKMTIPNTCLSEVMRILDGHNLGKSGGISLSSSEPASYVPTKSAYGLERDNNEASWEEMEMIVSNDSNTSVNTLFIMFLAGMLAAIGIATNSLHIVIGGMLVAPGFMPITRVALGFVGRNKGWYYGVFDFLKGYLVMIIAAALTAILLKVLGYEPLAGQASYFELTNKALTGYWTTVTTTSVLASAAASAAGALLVATKKSVYTSGVMIGLALVPTATIVGMGIVTGEYTLAQKAFIRFLLDVGLVFIFSLAVFMWIRHYYHKRDFSLQK